MIKLNLPWPPSWNHIYGIGKGKVYKKKAAHEFAVEVRLAIAKKRGWEGFGSSRVEVDIQAYPPDRRKRDLDNIQKILLDSLQSAGIYKEDCQVDKITISRGPVVPEGMLVVDIKQR